MAPTTGTATHFGSASPWAVLVLSSGERMTVQTGLPKLQQLLSSSRRGRVGLKCADGWRWVTLSDVARVEPLH